MCTLLNKWFDLIWRLPLDNLRPLTVPKYSLPESLWTQPILATHVLGLDRVDPDNVTTWGYNNLVDLNSQVSLWRISETSAWRTLLSSRSLLTLWVVFIVLSRNCLSSMMHWSLTGINFESQSAGGWPRSSWCSSWWLRAVAHLVVLVGGSGGYREVWGSYWQEYILCISIISPPPLSRKCFFPKTRQFGRGGGQGVSPPFKILKFSTLKVFTPFERIFNQSGGFVKIGHTL